MSELQRQLLSGLEAEGFKARMVAATHLPELRDQIQSLREAELIDRELYRQGLSFFRFDYAAELPAVRSLLIVALPEPVIRVRLEWHGQARGVVIPPIYSPHGDRQLDAVLQTVLGGAGYHFLRAQLPLKLLAVRSGLAEYGRNNVSYIAEWGSYYRLKAFVTDLDCQQDRWQPASRMRACDGCQACLANCPTKCIDPGRELIHAERCLTFFNESADPFPEWVDPSWHNAAIGCMACQSVCPQNTGRGHWQESADSLSSREVELLVAGCDFGQLPERLSRWLTEWQLVGDYRSGVLSRNLRALLSC